MTVHKELQESVAPEQTELEPYPHLQGENLYLINSRLLANTLKRQSPSIQTLTDVPFEYWERLLSHYSEVYFLGTKASGPIALARARMHEGEYREALPDLDFYQDIDSSPFSVPRYDQFHPLVAPNATRWHMFYNMIHYQLGKRLAVDVIPNHIGIDSPLAKTRPWYFIPVPDSYTDGITLPSWGHKKRLAYGRDPNFPGWDDNLQLNIAEPDVQDWLIMEMKQMTENCDVFRCDMAGLLAPETYENMWGRLLGSEYLYMLHRHPFWPRAIPEVKKYAKQRWGKDIRFYAEAYGDKSGLEDFDGIYAKDLRDHLHKLLFHEDPEHVSLQSIRNHLLNIARSQYQQITYLENQDEPRAMSYYGRRPALAVLSVMTFLPNTVLMIHQNQQLGYTVKMPLQLIRGPEEIPDTELATQYSRRLTLRPDLLSSNKYYDTYPCLTVGYGEHQTLLLQDLSNDYSHTLAVTNLGGNETEGFITLPQPFEQFRVLDLEQGTYLTDVATPSEDGRLYVKISAYGTQVVEVTMKR